MWKVAQRVLQGLRERCTEGCVECHLEGCAKDCVDGKISPMSKICPKENDLNNQVFITS